MEARRTRLVRAARRAGEVAAEAVVAGSPPGMTAESTVTTEVARAVVVLGAERDEALAAFQRYMDGCVGELTNVMKRQKVEHDKGA